MINWGILGLGRMGMAFANAIEETDNSKLIAIASKSGKKFKNFENLSYEDLIKKNDIDIIKRKIAKLLFKMLTIKEFSLTSPSTFTIKKPNYFYIPVTSFNYFKH